MLGVLTVSFGEANASSYLPDEILYVFIVSSLGLYCKVGDLHF